MFMYFDEASSYCAKAGARLPTARELACFAKTQGAKGIAELANGVPSEGNFLINAINPDGINDSFYLLSTGYKSTLHFPGIPNFWIWSSSKIKIEDSQKNPLHHFEDRHFNFDSGGGGLLDFGSDWTALVVCVPSR
ncbi:MAG: hypothetical protein ACK5WZ_07630 [Pseudobdellovibrionaceae bacterium]